MTHACVYNDTSVRLKWYSTTHFAPTPHIYVWSVWFTGVTWLVRMCHVPCLTPMCDMTQVSHASDLCVREWETNMSAECIHEHFESRTLCVTNTLSLSHIGLRRVTPECDMSHLTPMCDTNQSYGVATISKLLNIIGLFCKRALWKRLYSAKETSAKETYNFKAPTHRRRPIIPVT